MPGALFLEGEQVELRPIEDEDAELLQRMVNDPRVRRGILRSEPVSLPEERAWIEDPDEDGVHLGIAVDDSAGDHDADVDGRAEVADPSDVEVGSGAHLVGTISLKTDHDGHRTAEVGYLVDPAAWGNGYATDALEAICRYAFAERGLAKLVGRAYETNPASRRVLETAGFVEEGVLRAEVHVEGERVDVYRYGLLREEWFDD